MDSYVILRGANKQICMVVVYSNYINFIGMIQSIESTMGLKYAWELLE